MNHPPTVTVVVPVYNALPWLSEAMNSIIDQTIGQDRMEIIAIDDGSTDGSGDVLDGFAAEHSFITVVHQENSGGPGAPCNTGLEKSRGEFVYFVGADDYIGPEALARMVAMARKAKSDIVLGKMVPAPGFGNRAPRGMWGKNEKKVDLFTSKIYLTLSQVKLFRRAFIEEIGLRFPTGQLVSSDQPFAAEAYFRAETISVVADYDCYFIRNRPDDGNVTRRAQDPLLWLDQAERLLNLIARFVPAGANRDHLVTRHFQFEILPGLGSKHPRFADNWLNHSTPEEQRKVLDRVKELCENWLTDRVLANLPPHLRIRAYCVREDLVEELKEIIGAQLAGPGKPHCHDGRVFLNLPYFRDAAIGIPDEMYEITKLRVVHRLQSLDWSTDGELRLSGYAHISHVDSTGQSVELIVRERASKVEYRVPATGGPTPLLASDESPNDHTTAGFTTGFDFATVADGRPLPSGLWDLSLAVSSHGVDVQRRLGRERDPEVTAGHRLRVLPDGNGGRHLVDGYFGAAGNLSFDVGGKLGVLATDSECVALDSSTTHVDVSVRLPLAEAPEGVDVSLLLIRSGRTVVMPTETPTISGSGWTVGARLSTPVVKLRPGTWTVKALLGFDGGTRVLPITGKGGKSIRIGVFPRAAALLRKVLKR